VRAKDGPALPRTALPQLHVAAVVGCQVLGVGGLCVGVLGRGQQDHVIATHKRESGETERA
jgi:hypothetical protein